MRGWDESEFCKRNVLVGLLLMLFSMGVLFEFVAMAVFFSNTEYFVSIGGFEKVVDDGRRTYTHDDGHV